MASHRWLMSQLYQAARISSNFRATSRGQGAYAKLQVQRRAYRTGGGITRSILKAFGLSK